MESKGNDWRGGDKTGGERAARLLIAGARRFITRHDEDDIMAEHSPWPHQVLAIDTIRQAIKDGVRRFCICIPTGGGKSYVMQRAIEMIREEFDRPDAVLYTNRKLLTTQASEFFWNADLDHGIRASGHAKELHKQVQVSSIYSENQWVFKRGLHELHPAGLCLVDEAHNMTSKLARQIIAEHDKQGAITIGFTATPVGLSCTLSQTNPQPLYERLFTVANNSDLRKCGAHVSAFHFAPDEPELGHIGRTAVGEYLQGEVVKRMMIETIYGRVIKHYRLYNPEGRPTILFAPGVKESRWFVEQFMKQGITAAHIDASTPPEERKAILAGSRDGTIKVLCNRFVLREGVNAPWLSHCIFATMFGALSNYLQAGGRLLRPWPGVDRVTVQDHGGSYHAFGSLNEDREWELGDTDLSIEQKKKAARNSGAGEPEPIVCPKCHAIRKSGPKCWNCGHQHKLSVRYVVQLDGTLKPQSGKIYKPKKGANKSPQEKAWTTALYQCANAKQPKTFKQAMGLYREKMGEWPPMGLPMMPTGDTNDPDWKRFVKDVHPWMKRQPKKKK